MPRVQPTKYTALEDELVLLLGRDYVLSSPVDLAVYECDGESMDVAIPDLVVLPKTTAEVQEIVRVAAKHRVPVTARGAGTGLSGGSTPIMGGISLVLTRMDKVLSIDPENFVAHVQVGVTNVAVSKAGAAHGLYFAPDPSSQSASTIGGNIAENAGGAHTLKYGLTTNNVLGAKVVLADGQVTTFGGAVRDSLGMDLLGVFVGSEGTIGIATEAWLRLIPRAQATETLLAYFPSLEDGGQAVSDIVAHGVIPAAMEMIDKLTVNCVEDSFALGLNREAAALLIVELDGPNAGIRVERETVEQCVRAHACLETKWANDETERALIWKARKMSFGSLGRLAPHGYVLDGVIPRSKLSQAITQIEAIGSKYNVLIANVYHAGDGNLHPCLLFDRDNEEQVGRVLKAANEILEMCVELGGTLSGEHGIGIEKIGEMTFAFSSVDLDAMRALRVAFDPQLLLNPGKLVPTPKSCGESGRRPLLRHRLSAC
jgi:glycolate oxidase subunit GlcD